MRVFVKEESGQKVDIRIPTVVALNRITMGLASKACQKNGVDISKKQLVEFAKAIRGYKKHHKDWKLLEIVSADGEHVEIIL